MKLADLEKVGKLKSERDYLLNLARWAEASFLHITFSGGGKLDLRPDIVNAVRPALTRAIAEAVAKVDRDLAALGVVIQGED